MNIIKLLETFTNESFLNAKGSRRDSLGQLGLVGKNVALAAVPLGLFFTQKSNAAVLSATAETPTDALKLALTLEYLEDEFYSMGMNQSGFIPSAHMATIEKIAQHESAHVQFLQDALGNDAPAKPEFDFTANGAFDTFTNYETFLALAQAFEDTGVRAYKGQATNLMSKPDLLQAALQIHSVEARHASQIRRLRGEKGWIEGNSRGTLPIQAQPVYDGEQNTTQASFNTSTVLNIPAAAGSESFDEPLTGAQATSIAGLFIV